jgi:LPXTG-motif cell wall-anchored protein
MNAAIIVRVVAGILFVGALALIIIRRKKSAA